MSLSIWPFRHTYDIFVSYKSYDVHIARHVAEQLIASGKQVWFAEYEILLRRYAKFQAAVDTGTRRCKYGLAFTNDRYAGSTHCQREMTQLIEHCGPQRVLEVRMPAEEQPRRIFPALAHSPTHDGKRVNDILDFVREQTGWLIDNIAFDVDALPRQHTGAICMDQRYQLDIAGWEVVSLGEQHVRGPSIIDWNLPRRQLEIHLAHGYLPISVEGPSLRRDDGAFTIHMNLYAGPELSRHAQRFRPNPDDREMYRELMEYLPRHLRRLWFSRLRGLHLLFQSGFSQMAVTYRWSGYWTRKYSVIMPHPKSSVTTEFVFTFGFKGPFEEYCRRAHLMDKVVTSLEWV